MANGGTIYWRVQKLEEEIKELQREMREEREGMTTPEKLMLWGIVVSTAFAIIGVVVALGVFT